MYIGYLITRLEEAAQEYETQFMKLIVMLREQASGYLISYALNQVIFNISIGRKGWRYNKISELQIGS
jgi:hypothetical protein